MMKKSESGEKKEEKKRTNETKMMNEKDKMKGMKKVKENAGREVRKKEVKKNEGEAAKEKMNEGEAVKEKMKGDSEAVKEMNKAFDAKAIEEVRKKEVKKNEGEAVKEKMNEGEAVKEKMKGDSEALNQSEMESILNNRFSDFKEEIKALFENQMKSKLDQLICEFQEVKTAMTFLNEKYEEVLQENKLLKQQISSFSKTKETIEANQESCNSMKIKINDLENAALSCNLEIHGVPEKPNENVERIALNVIKLADPSADALDIESTFRVIKKSPTAKDSSKESTDKNSKKKAPAAPIIVKLKTKSKRMDIIKKRKQLADVDFKNIGIDADRVYINENLTPMTRSLFYESNKLKKLNGWSSIWTFNGIIKMKRKEGSPIVTIRDISDLSKITK